ncbi:selenoneine biosynthesis selenosugar synthase SenB [Caenimonas soli]|uniref:selenoneine biosynthesis selenosugar synthase SenB n=1 Tax=Caenimonas soli TaxID=2735555 RepID=UPI0015579FA3|nr:selenoneine biosynthesis selenosugar synthase SenB [Caenimonas soli]NPC57637.1 TIGR04348 family glycosyltransferase [Caenimonas soli]
MLRPSVVIVSPALAAANNGNWQTARRWRQLLSPHWRVRIVQHWPDENGEDAFMLALHARRSADAIQAWAQAHPGRGLVVVLTGTDLYGDLANDREAQRSVEAAQRLVVLQELGAAALSARLREKTRVIYQSTTARAPLRKSAARLRATMVGHLRQVKSPETLFQAARLLSERDDIRIDHIGEAEEPVWAEQATATQAQCPGYRWLGPLPHAQARQAIQRAHVLVHTSAAEGGAHVIMEAVRSGTPVLASRIPGNVGMLGPDYEGYFEHGNAPALAALLVRCREDQARAANDPAPPLLERLRAQCSLRAPLFAPETERRALLQLLQDLQEPS